MNSSIKKETPVMRQFREAKKSHPDSIMLFRMGDFYETFDKDAIVASEILGITLTKRSNGAASAVPLAGFPYHSLDQYLHKLLKAGHRVAICEQVEDPKKAKGIVKRDVVEVLSPGTAISDQYLDEKKNNFFSSLFIIKDKVGIALIDYSTGEFRCGEFKLEEMGNIINQFSVTEIIIPQDQFDLLSEKLKIKNYFITKIPDYVINKETGSEILTKLFKTNSLKGFGVENLNSGICAAGNAIRYLDKNFMGKMSHLVSLKLIDNNEVMTLDPFTIKNLELFYSLSNSNLIGTFIDVIGKMQTPQGNRLIRKWIRRPLLDKNRINSRLNRISEIFDNKELFNYLMDNLKHIFDIDRIIAKLSTNKANPKDLINLSNSLVTISNIKSNITNKTPELNNLLTKLVDTSGIQGMINDTIKDEPSINLNKGHFIKRGFSEELDRLHDISHSGNDWLVNFQLEEREKTNIPSLKIGYNKVFGYYIEVTKTHSSKVPDNYIRKQTLTNAERYFTEDLKEYENQILSAEDKIQSLELEIFNSLRQNLLIDIQPMLNNSIIISKVDIALSLTNIAKNNNYVKPIISNNNNILIKNSRHPVVEKLLPLGEDFIANDICLSTDEKQIAIITGPNMSGKSTYLRQIGLIVIMAQMGSFVPASHAEIGIVDKLFTRVGASDNLAEGESTFLVEMNETANILNNTTDKSLIILDEIGRGTSTYDGLSIAWAITEFIHNNKSSSAKTLFATHYHELVDLANSLNRAFNLNVNVKEIDDDVVFLRKIVEGGTDKSYGIYVAKMAGLPNEVILRANEILNSLSSNRKKTENIEKYDSERIQQSTDLYVGKELIGELSNIDINSLSPIEALKKLDELKNKYKI
tara:strand:- start:5195 stop:7789 length:2595 start_codon:yes stop_codon:yes gene_type:complete